MNRATFDQPDPPHRPPARPQQPADGRETDEQRPDRVALLLGAEGDGLSRRAMQSADTVVTIPMAGGVDSLNVAAAAAVALWALRSPL